MIESYLMGMVTGFLLGVAVVVIPEKLRRVKEEYIELKRKKI